MSIRAIQQALAQKSAKEKAEKLRRFFKTGPGMYGEGDVFIGVTVPEIRAIVGAYDAVPISDCVRLLHSRIHEERLAALVLLVTHYTQAPDEATRAVIYEVYLDNTAYVNNWDLVDLSAQYIVGRHIEKRPKTILRVLAKSPALWERRIAIVATWWLIRCGQYAPTLRIAKLLLQDSEDLIHKAVGWMLREVGKRDKVAEETFLKKYYTTMPRTMLRYAIEKFPEKERRAYLSGAL